MTQNNINSKNPLVQIKTASTGSLFTCNVAIPFDDTIPQNTEGTEVLTLSITPKFSNSTLEFLFSSMIQLDGVATVVTAALFQDSAADAIAAESYEAEVATWGKQGNIRYLMTAGTTSSTTFKVRVGPNTSTCYVNGNVTRYFGGVANTRLTIKEYLG